MEIDKSVFREYDIRGIWGRSIDRDFAFGLGRAFGIYLKSKLSKDRARISVGYDARLSSRDIFGFLSAGLNCESIDVIDIGLIPTPAQYFSLFTLDVDGGIMITASHNPKEYNGFKLSVGKETLFGSQIREVAELLEQLNVKELCKQKGKMDKVDILKDYKEYMLEQFGYLKSYRDKPVIALDGGNGTAGFVAYDIFRELGYEVYGLYIEPDGNFPNHHPDPTVIDNLEEMIGIVKSKGLEVGIGYDGDGDRIGVVLRDGSILWGDQLVLLFAQDLVKREKGIKVVADVKCSDVVFEKMREIGAQPIMYKTGHSLIKAKMKEEKAHLAGEMSGHIFIGDRYFGYDDAIYVSLRLVEIITRDKVDLLKWRESLPTVYNTPEIRINCPEDKKRYVIGQMAVYLESKKDELGIIDTNTIDGIRFKTKNGWGLVRASNTQPALVLRFEANTQENLESIKNLILSVVESFVNG